MATSVLSSNALSFKSAGADLNAVLTATDNVLTFSSTEGNVQLKGVTDPTAAQDAATKAYVDAHTSGAVNAKESVRAATVTGGTLASDFENGDTIDGVVLATGDRILIKNQASGVENGIYTVSATGAPTRADDMEAGDSAASAYTFVEEGTANATVGYLCTDQGGSDVVGTDALSFVNYAVNAVAAGDGLGYSAGVMNVKTGLGLTTSADDVIIDTAVVPRLGTANNFTSGDQDVADNIVLSGTAQDKGTITLSQTVAPTSTTDKLYNVGGTLTFDGTALGGSVASGTSTRVAYYASSGTEVSDASGVTITDSATTVTATSFISTSDERLKTNITPITDALEKTSKLDGVSFDFIKNGVHSGGVIAQQVQQIWPEIVRTQNEGTAEEHLSVQYSAIIGLLIESVKELAAEVKELKSSE